MNVEGGSSESYARDSRRIDHARSPPTFETSCYENIVGCSDAQSSALFRDVELVDSCSPREAKTFWVPANSCPMTSLELLAKIIFDFHAKDLRQQEPRSAGNGTSYATSRAGCAESGAEWWVQRREEGHHANLGMPFHWDKDEKKLEEEGIVLCPAVSTVTYLTDHGAPTVVLESRVSERGAVQDGDIERTFVSYPALFKHLAFDGGFLHGVPEQLIRTGGSLGGGGIEIRGSSGGQSDEGTASMHNRSPASIPSSSLTKRRRVRVTLLVNVWLSHRPDGVSPLPAALAASLSRSSGPGAPPRPRFDLPVAFSPVTAEENMTDAKKRKETPSRQEKADGMVSARETGGSAVVIREPLGPTLLLELRAPAPDRLSAGDLKALHSFTLVCGAGSSSRISTRHEERAGGAACVDGAARAGGGSGTDRGFVGQEVAGGGEGGYAKGRRTPRKRKCEVEA